MKSFLFLLLGLLPLFGQQGEVAAFHRAVQVENVSYDAMLTRPASPGRHPAVYIIGGLGCYSLDNLEPDDSYKQFIDGLTRRGFVTMRVDKNGEGRSGGPPCDSPQSDLQLAVRRSAAGLNALAAYDFVDRNNIFLFAHSIGPLEGVLAAQKLEFPLRGFIAAETIGKTWMEYTLENTRRQLLLLGSPYDRADRTLRLAELCQHRFLIEKRAPEEMIRENPDCRDHVQTFGVAATYLQQIADLDLAVEWKKVDVPVLVTYGTSDPTTSAADGHYLVEMINSFHPGRAEYLELAGMGHGLDRSPSPRAWLEAVQKRQHGEFDREFLERVAAWMERTVSGKAR